MRIPDFYWQDGDGYLIEDSPASPTSENTSNTF